MPVALRHAPSIVLLLALAACAGGGAGGGGGGADPGPAAASEGLVLQMSATGGFVTPQWTLGRLPLVSVYADGRVISEGPVDALYPGPALPNVLVATIDPGAVQDLVDQAFAAGVAETGDLGMPPVADVSTTRFTVVTREGTFLREAYALGMPDPDDPTGDGLTDDQRRARSALAGLGDALLAVAQPGDPATAADLQPYVPDALAAITSPYVGPDDPELVRPEVPWPGPALPGDTVGVLDVGCVTVTGPDVAAVLTAAGSADALTPWTTGDGRQWAITFRPLLPHESDCTDLTGR